MNDHGYHLTGELHHVRHHGAPLWANPAVPGTVPAERVDAGTIAMQRSLDFQARQDRQRRERIDAAEDAALDAMFICLVVSLVEAVIRGFIEAFRH